MKLQKRFKIMVDDFFILPKGAILTFDKHLDAYLDKYGKSYNRKWIEESLGTTLAQPLSADGLIWEEINNKDYQVYNERTEDWIDWDRPIRLNNIGSFRLKPRVEYIPVPESIELWTSREGRGNIINKERICYIAVDDRLQTMISSIGITPHPHQIDTRVPESFEDGQIYYEIYGDNTPFHCMDDIDDYFVYCAKMKAVYSITSHYLIRCKKEPKLSGFRKVIPIKEL